MAYHVSSRLHLSQFVPIGLKFTVWRFHRERITDALDKTFDAKPQDYSNAKAEQRVPIYKLEINHCFYLPET